MGSLVSTKGMKRIDGPDGNGKGGKAGPPIDPAQLLALLGLWVRR